jgi:hypothetical protein
MPLHAALRFAEARIEQVLAACLAQRNIEQVDLADRGGADLTAERVGQQLMAETNAEERLVVLGHPGADRCLLILQPGEPILLPDVHRATHNHEDVEAIEIGNGIAPVEPNDRRRDAVGGEVAGERSGMTVGGMLEDDDAWKHQVPWKGDFPRGNRYSRTFAFASARSVYGRQLRGVRANS